MSSTRKPRLRDVMSILGLLLLAAASEVRVFGQAETYLAAALANAAAIKNYDCLVKTEKVFIPIEENRDADGGHYLDEVERLIFDNDKQLSFNIAKRRFTATDPNKMPKFKVELPFESRTKSGFANGKPLITNGRRDSIRTFIDFLHSQRIPRMDFASVNGYPYIFSEPATKEEHIENQILRAAEAKITLQPDGMVGWFLDREQNNFAEYKLFDPKTSLIKRATRKQKRDGAYPAGITSSERHYTYEEVDGIFRLVQMDFEEAATSFSPYSVVGTTQIEWLQFNEDQLEVPSEETFMTSIGEKGEFFLKGLMKEGEDAQKGPKAVPR